MNAMRKKFLFLIFTASVFGWGLSARADGTFQDVPKDAWFYEYVEALAQEQIIDSSAENYRPNDILNRAELVKIVIEATLSGSGEFSPKTPTFLDVKEDTWFYNYVETAFQGGIVSGYKDAKGELTGLFGPSDPVTRSAAMKIIVNAFEIEEDLDPAAQFEDVEEDAWYYPYVATAYNQSIVDGYKNQNGNSTGAFGPNDYVTRAQIAKMIVNAWSPVEREKLEYGSVAAPDGAMPDKNKKCEERKEEQCILENLKELKEGTEE